MSDEKFIRKGTEMTNDEIIARVYRELRIQGNRGSVVKITKLFDNKGLREGIFISDEDYEFDGWSFEKAGIVRWLRKCALYRIREKKLAIQLFRSRTNFIISKLKLEPSSGISYSRFREISSWAGFSGNDSEKILKFFHEQSVVCANGIYISLIQKKDEFEAL